MTKKLQNPDYKRPSEKRAEEMTEQTRAAKDQKESLKKPIEEKPKSPNNRKADVTDKHHDS